MRLSRTIIFFINIYIFLITSSANAVNQEYFELEEVNGWRIIKDVKNSSVVCHAISLPYRVKNFSESINDPKFIISYVGKNSFTASFSASTKINKFNGVVMLVNDQRYHLYQNSHTNAVTYSSNQDVNLLNDIISGPYGFKVKVYGSKGEFSISYFSSIGMTDAMLYMSNNCK